MKRLLFGLFVLVGIALLSGCEVPTGFTVNATVDAPDAVPGDGVCETAVEDQCTLRAAVMEANALDTPVAVELAEGATYQIAPSGADGDDHAGAVGDLDITGHLAVTGNGATIAVTSGRLLENQGTLRLDDLTLRGPDSTGGMALLNQGAAMLTDVLIDNWLFGDGVENMGGGLTLDRTTIRNTQRALRLAPTVESQPETVIVDSALYSAACVPACGGTVILQSGGELTVVNSTISSQRRTGFWPCGFLGTCPIPIEGDGLVQTGGSATLVRTTVADNLTGIIGTDVTMLGSVVADNTVADCSAPVTSQGYNHDEDGTCLAAPTTGDQTADPAGLATTITDHHIAPLAGSALLDRIPVGIPHLCDDAHPVDQRGTPRPSGPACDIGAIERQPTDP